MAAKKKAEEEAKAQEDADEREAARLEEVRQRIKVKATMPEDYWRSAVTYEIGVTLLKGKPVTFTCTEAFRRQLVEEGITVEKVEG